VHSHRSGERTDDDRSVRSRNKGKRMAFKNFRVWRGRLPHWRADNVCYYVTFRHRRPLEDAERRLLLRALLKPDGRQWDLAIICVLPETTELMARVMETAAGSPHELSSIVEKAKAKAGRQIMKATGEKWPPFYNESYDRIVRDESEMDARWNEIVDSPVGVELVQDPEEYDSLWVAGAD
jgi:hypothetical protein